MPTAHTGQPPRPRSCSSVRSSFEPDVGGGPAPSSASAAPSRSSLPASRSARTRTQELIERARRAGRQPHAARPRRRRLQADPEFNAAYEAPKLPAAHAELLPDSPRPRPTAAASRHRGSARRRRHASAKRRTSRFSNSGNSTPTTSSAARRVGVAFNERVAPARARGHRAPPRRDRGASSPTAEAARDRRRPRRRRSSTACDSSTSLAMADRQAGIAWSAGAMALTDRIVLFHDYPP